MENSTSIKRSNQVIYYLMLLTKSLELSRKETHIKQEKSRLKNPILKYNNLNDQTLKTEKIGVNKIFTCRFVTKSI